MGTAVVFSVVTLALGMVFGYACGVVRVSDTRYANPQLHEGPYRVRQANSDVGLVLERLDPPSPAVLRAALRSGMHQHVAHVCTVTPGAAHVDECVCGATRYGVFGQWS